MHALLSTGRSAGQAAELPVLTPGVDELVAGGVVRFGAVDPALGNVVLGGVLLLEAGGLPSVLGEQAMEAHATANMNAWM